MRRVLVVAALAGGLLLAALPVSAEPVEGPADAREREAVDLLLGASRAARSVTYTGTQRIASWTSAGASSDLVEVRTDAPAGPDLDPRRIALLADSYDLEIARDGACAGRAAHVVEATRADGSLAARFWIDRASGLLLRHEVRGDNGRRLRGSTFVDVEIASQARVPVSALSARLPDARTVQQLQARGWQVPPVLPGGFRLFETDVSTVDGGEQVLHLAYSDGLSHVSLFAQHGELGTDGVEGFEPEAVGDRPVWRRHADQEQAVWSGAGQVWTLVSDASPSRVRDALAVLPRDLPPRDGLGARLQRGMGRLASMLNPFT